MKTIAILAAVGAIGLASPVLAQDVAKVSPHTTKVIFENQYIRVIKSSFKPGESEPLHSHPAGWYYVTKGGSLKVTGADGKPEVWKATTGHNEWGDGEAPHTAINPGKHAMEYILVEVKAAPNKAAH